MRMRSRALLIVAMVAVASCQDGLFFEPAPGLTSVTVRLVWPEVEAGAVGGQRVEGPARSPGAAFDKADGAQVTVRSGERELFNQRLPLEAAGSDRKVTFTVELPSGGALPANLEMVVLRGTDVLFRGSGSAQLAPGQATEVSLQMSLVVARVEAGGPYVIRTLGGTVKVVAEGLFATGDPAGATPTFRALDATVSVAADGTVTALSNGTGRVEVSFPGALDTVSVNVEDRCHAPFPRLTLGGTVNGELEADDCLDAPNFAHNDWYELTLDAPTLVRATLSSSAYDPFVGASAPDKTVLAVAANTGQPLVISDYFFPAGTYLVRAGSRARTEGPVPSGAYTLKVEAVPSPEPNVGCLAGRTTTWMLRGHEATGHMTPDDCPSGANLRYDRYGIRLQAGDTVTATITSAYEHRIQWSHDGGGARVLASASAAGGTTSFLLTAATEGSSYVWFFPWPGGSAGGEYTIRLEEGVAPSYDKCAIRENLFIGPTYVGTLDPASDCLLGDSYIDRYVASFPDNAPVRTILTSTDFAPFVVGLEEGRQTAGRARETGEVMAEHVYPGGHHEVGVLSARGVSAGSGFSGAYTLVARRVDEPQATCIGTAFVYFGSVASGRVTPEDCLDEEAPDAGSVTRWWDGYSILLLPGESVTASMTAHDAPLDFTRWDEAGFVEGAFQVQPGQTVTLTATQPADGGAAFHGFFPISGGHQGTGDYTVSFSGAPSPGASRVAPLAAWHPPLRLPGRRGGGGGSGPAR